MSIYMRFLLSFACVLCLFTTTLIAQTSPSWQRGQSLSAAKVSSHHDTPLQCLEFVWLDSTSTWDSLAQTTFTYSINGALETSIRSNFDGSAFVLYERNQYAYYPDGSVKDKWYLYRNGNAWDSVAHDTYAYDAFGNTTVYLNYNYNGSNWDRVAGERKDLTYRNVDQIETQVGWQWQFNGQTWLRVDSIYYAFDGNNERMSDTHFGYSGVGWEPSFRWLDYSWYNFGKLLPSAGRKQIYSAPTWVDVERFTATYSPFDSPTAIFEQSMAPGQWDTAYKIVQQFDAQDHEILSEIYLYNGAFILYTGRQELYTYDGLGNTLERITRDNNGIAYNNAQRYLYANFFLAAPKATQPLVEVIAYPNPVQADLHLRLQLRQAGPVLVQLYDLQGRLRAETLSPYKGGELTFPLSETLENGCYLYHVSTKEGVADGKVVVQR
jgi:hypothetical protein